MMEDTQPIGSGATSQGLPPVAHYNTLLDMVAVWLQYLNQAHVSDRIKIKISTPTCFFSYVYPHFLLYSARYASLGLTGIPQLQ